jgi:hypothetical protein
MSIIRQLYQAYVDLNKKIPGRGQAGGPNGKY